MGLKEERAAVRLDEIIRQVVERFETAARENHIELMYQRPEGCPVTVIAGTEGVDRIFNNLVSNAIKYTPAGGRVLVMLSLE